MISSMTVTRFKKKNNLEDGGGAWVDEKETRVGGVYHFHGFG